MSQVVTAKCTNGALSKFYFHTGEQGRIVWGQNCKAHSWIYFLKCLFQFYFGKKIMLFISYCFVQKALDTLSGSCFIFKTATSITGSTAILSLRPFWCHLCSCEVQARTGCSSSLSHKSLVFLLSWRENLHTLNIIMQVHDCSILLGQLCRNILHEQLGLRQDINKSEDHEGPRMMALRSEIKMPFIAICLYIFYTLVSQKRFCLY